MGVDIPAEDGLNIPQSTGAVAYQPPGVTVIDHLADDGDEGDQVVEGKMVKGGGKTAVKPAAVKPTAK